MLLAGCKKPDEPAVGVAAKDYAKPLPPGEVALRKITDPADIPDFTKACANKADLRLAINNSIDFFNKASSTKAYPYGKSNPITHDQALETMKAFLAMLDSNMTAAEMNQKIRADFVYISVGCDDLGTVLFTGYYTPIFDASPTQTGAFRYPLYKAPDTLVRQPEGEILGMKMADGSIAKPGRRETEKLCAGLELYWLKDPFEVYIAQVQGSAKLRLPGGKLVTVGYAGINGNEYHSIAKDLVADGKIPAGKLSLRAMIDYFKANPADVDKYTARNPRFVFFAESAENPHGSINEPVTDMRTIATDKTIYPRGCLAFFSAKIPRRAGDEIITMPYTGFALDQDTGGAIRAAGRCDIYMGVGDGAGELAGRTQEEGKLYYIFVKPTAMGGSPLTPSPASSHPIMQP
jgi:membrane-bound lytic murein transglycosylase A